MEANVLELESPAKYRDLKGPARYCQRGLLISLPVVGIVFILGLHTRVGLMVYQEQYVGLFLALTLGAVFLGVRPSARSPQDRVPWYDILLALGGLLVGLYLAIYYPSIVPRLSIGTPERLALGALAILLVLEATRRMVGWAVLIIASLTIVYALTRPYFPGVFGGRAITWSYLINDLYVQPSGIFYMLGIAATIGLAFILFGQVLFTFGGDRFFTDLAIGAMGRYRGGPAKASVISSSLIGTISGGPVTNVVMDGVVTIPLMKKSGYSPPMAAAIEAVTSTGGQIMPPVMGTGAFVMAEFLQIPYATVALAALIPACLYYVALFVQIDLHAAQNGLRGLSPSQLPRLATTIKECWIFGLVMLILLYTMFVTRLSPSMAGVTSALVALALVVLFKQHRERFWSKVLRALEETGSMLLTIGVILAASGIIVGVTGVTGLGVNISIGLVQIAGANVLLLLVMAAAVCFILGMGMPTVAAYVLVATLVAPALAQLGIDLLAAHLFVFYWGILSAITPPVAVASIAAATLAKANFWQTGLLSCRMAVLAYLVPFLFVFEPSLILKGSVPQILLTLGISVLICWVLGIVLVGHLYRAVSWWARAVLSVGVVGLIASVVSFGTPIGVAGGVVGALLSLPILALEWHSSRVRPVPVTVARPSD